MPHPASAGNQVWSGTGPRAKSVQAIVRDPFSAARMWAATFGAGVYRSLDGGATWTGFRNGLVNTYVRCLAVNPIHPDSLYCGTNDGVFLSTDGGANWSWILPTIVSVRGLAIHPRRTRTVYAATYGTGVFKSVDGGGHWFSTNGVQFQLTNTNVRDIVLQPNKPDTVYVAAGTGGGVQRSFNGGVDWTPVPDTTATRGAVEQIQFDALNPQRIYAAAFDRGVLTSADGGNNWARINRGLSSFRCRSLAVADTLRYVGTENAGAFFTTLNDPSWHPVNTGLTNLAVDALCASRTNPSTVWAGTDGDGIFRSDNRGGNWSHLDGGLLTTFGFSLAVRPSTHVVYDGTGFGDRFWRSTNQGATWTRARYLFTHNSVRAVVPDPVSSQTIYLAAYGAGVYRSTNDGDTWVNPDSLSGTLQNVFVRALVAWPGQSGHLFVGSGNGVYESVNGGTTWAARSFGLPVPFGVRSLALVPGTLATLYAGGDTSGVYKSTDGGNNWFPRNAGLVNLFIHDLLVDSGMPQTIYAATNAGVFKSANGGSTWFASNTGLPPSPSARALAQDPVHPYVLFCGVWGTGVFESRDGGASWQSVFAQAGLPSVNLYALSVDGALNTLYVGTDAGVASLSNYSVAVSDAGRRMPPRLALAVWPNPAPSGRASIQYSLSRENRRARLEIFDASGARVRRLEAIPGQAGAHVLAWDGLDRRGRPVPAGVYFLRLQCEEGVRTARLVASRR